MRGLSVCLSFSPRNENPPGPRAEQLRAHYLPSLFWSPPYPSIPSHPASSQDCLWGSCWGFLMGQKGRGSPLPQLCPENCLAWVWSGELAAEQRPAGRQAGMNQVAGPYGLQSPTPSKSLGCPEGTPPLELQQSR